MIDVLVPIIAILSVFGMPALIVYFNRSFKLREKQLELEAARLAAGGGSDQKPLAASEKERKLLEERVQNLESIVCSVDFELNQRLNRLAAGISSVSAPPAALVAMSTPVTPVANAKLDEAHGTTQVAPISERRLGQLSAGQTVLSRYHVERELGRGGMGAVYLARDEQLGERVALKVISSATSDDPAAMTARFRREVAAARKVTHPNVVRIHDLGEDGALLFLSMEFVDGETLHARVRRSGPLPLPIAIDVLTQIALGVAAAHAVGVVHRDLKPQNVLLAERADGARVVKVIDFGLATSSFLAGMTATGMILGTPEYMAPEQLRGGACDARTDVYALGAMAYHAVTGRPPFVGDTPIAVGFAHLNEPPRSPRDLRAELPAALDAAILRALSKDPAKRFPDADRFRQALVAG